MAIRGFQVSRCDLRFKLLIVCVHQILRELGQCLVKILNDVLNVFGAD